MPNIKTEYKEQTLSPWVPVTDKRKLAILGKTLEELSELSAIISRCIIQGIDGCDPVTNKPNIQSLYEELIDVSVMIDFVRAEVGLDDVPMLERYDAKVKRMFRWLNMIGVA